MTPTQTEVVSIHSAYRCLTGLDIPLGMREIYYWQIYLSAGHTEPDLAAVVRYIRGRIKEKRREVESLMFRNLIANLSNFEDDLSVARAESRQHTERNQDAAKKSVLAAVGRKMPEKEARPVVNIMEESAKLAAMLKQWRESQL